MQPEEGKTLEYDFRNVHDTAGEVSAEIDYLEPQELVKVHEAIQEIKKQAKEQKQKWFSEWFQASLLPILRNFAKRMEGTLSVNWETESVVLAELRSADGFDFGTKEHSMMLLFAASNYVSIELSGKECVLVLSFDGNQF